MDEAKSYFFCGIGGSGMLPLALIVQGRGAEVAGSDRTLDQGRLAPKFEFLQRARHRALPAGRQRPDRRRPDPRHLGGDRGDGARRGQGEGARRARGSTGPSCSPSCSTPPTTGIAVGGTSGKSTVTGMIGWILHATGRDPTVMNGAVMKNFVDARRALRQRPGRRAATIFVSEVDESDGSIALYRPTIAVLNNISLDHKSLDELRHLFRDFAAKAETVVVNLDDDETRLLAAVLPAERLRHLRLRR